MFLRLNTLHNLASQSLLKKVSFQKLCFRWILSSFWMWHIVSLKKKRKQIRLLRWDSQRDWWSQENYIWKHYLLFLWSYQKQWLCYSLLKDSEGESNCHRFSHIKYHLLHNTYHSVIKRKKISFCCLLKKRKICHINRQEEIKHYL